MKSYIFALALVSGATALSTTAHADVHAQVRAEVRADGHFDSKGWTLLGEQTVDGRHDTDIFRVGLREGRFEKIMMVVLDDDLQLDKMQIALGNGTLVEPQVKQYFGEGTRTRAIDLPGEARGIDKITLTYGNVAPRDRKDKRRDDRHGVRSGGARVQLWGLEAAPPAPATVAIGTRRVTARSGSVTFQVPSASRNLDQLQLATSGSMRITRVEVTYTSGRKGTFLVKRGQDLPSTLDLDQTRAVRSIRITYANPARGRVRASTIALTGVVHATRDGGGRGGSRGGAHGTVRIY
ncbi:MAG: hypothetical protein KC464_05005 [Myxococcales bacterium]|nr:hypothetical protein [Myxococcales bacterium]